MMVFGCLLQRQNDEDNTNTDGTPTTEDEWQIIRERDTIRNESVHSYTQKAIGFFFESETQSVYFDTKHI